MKTNTNIKNAAGVGGLADEGAEALSRLLRTTDEVGSLVSPGLKTYVNNIADAGKDLRFGIADILNFVTDIVDDAAETRRLLDNGGLLSKLEKTEEGLAEALRIKGKHHKNWQAALAKNEALVESFEKLTKAKDEGLDAILKEKGNLVGKVKELEGKIDLLADQALVANKKIMETVRSEKALEGEALKLSQILSETGARADVAETALESLTKQNAELAAAYKKVVKESGDAAKAAEDARKSGAPEAVTKGLDAAAAGKAKAVDDMGTAITKGDKAAEQALKQEAKVLADQAAALEKAKQGKNFIPDTASGAFGRGFREGVKELGQGFGKGLVKGVAVLGVLGIAAYMGGPSIISWWYQNDKEDALRTINEFDSLLKDAHAKLSKVKFIDGSSTQQIQANYLKMMADCFGLLQKMLQNHTDNAFVQESGTKILTMLQQTDTFLSLKDIYASDLVSQNGWMEAIIAIQELKKSGDELVVKLNYIIDEARKSQNASKGNKEEAGTGGYKKQQRPDPHPDDKGIDVLGQRIYLSQYTELDPATRSAAPSLIRRVLLSPTGLSFWDPQGQWGGGYLPNTGTISDQVMKHILFFMNPRSSDSDWSYGPIKNQADLKKFMRKNMPRAGKRRDSGYKSTRRNYRKKRPNLASSNNTITSSMESTMKNREKRLQILEKIDVSTNRSTIFTENIDKYADTVSKQFYQDALRDLDDQYAKSYYTGLKSMYDQKLGGEKADYKSLYEPHGSSGTEIIQSSHPKSVVISDAMGNGGLVENVLEQQRHDIGVALSTPTGNFRGKHANLVDALIKIANATDSIKYQATSELVDNAIEDIVTILKS